MARALELARHGLCTTTPNPRVGCVIVRGEGVIGEGWHERAGSPHAEVNALAAAGANVRGATAYVTLEPCAHHGRTPPCADALVEAGLARVVVAMEDPNPLTAGKGLAVLKKAGITAQCGLLESEARELNIGFVSRMTRGRPWVRMKIAASLDGKTALITGSSKGIGRAIAEAMAGADFTVLSVPSQTLRANLAEWTPMLAPGTVLVSLMKGVELGTTMRMSEVIEDVAKVGHDRIAVVTGASQNIGEALAVREAPEHLVAVGEPAVEAGEAAESCETREHG